MSLPATTSPSQSMTPVAAGSTNMTSTLPGSEIGSPSLIKPSISKGLVVRLAGREPEQFDAFGMKAIDERTWAPARTSNRR